MKNVSVENDMARLRLLVLIAIIVSHCKKKYKGQVFSATSVYCITVGSLEKEAEDFTTSVLLLGLLVIDNTIRSGENDVAELSGWEEIVGPVIDLK